MEVAEPWPELEPSPQHGRVRRGIGLIAASVVTIAVAGIAFLHPQLSWPNTHQNRAPVGSTSYRVAAVDFVDPNTGWVVALFANGDYAVLHTTNGGMAWKQQLSVPGDGHPQYMKFFGPSVGVFALEGTQPTLYRTADGGKTWTELPAPATAGGAVLSWSFVDSDHGWMLLDDPRQSAPSSNRLLRTSDGGRRWSDLGPPVKAPDRAFQVHFSNLTTGWLTTASAGAYAYRTHDLGATWSRVALPSPPTGSSRFGEFFVAVHPTSGFGALASVVYFTSIQGRSGVGGRIRGFPPLTVSGFDGGRPQTYTVTTVIDQIAGGPIGQDLPPNQAALSTVDNGARWTAMKPPSPEGAIGYFDAFNWWWIGSGAWSTSSDGGLTWSDRRDVGVTAPLPGSLQMLDRNHAWFGAFAGALPALEITSDGGVHWRLLLLPPIAATP